MFWDTPFFFPGRGVADKISREWGLRTDFFLLQPGFVYWNYYI